MAPFLLIFHGNGVQGHVGHMAIFMIVYNAELLLSMLRFAKDLDKVDIALMGYTILFKLLFMHLKESQAKFKMISKTSLHIHDISMLQSLKPQTQESNTTSTPNILFTYSVIKLQCNNYYVFLYCNSAKASLC